MLFISRLLERRRAASSTSFMVPETTTDAPTRYQLLDQIKRRLRNESRVSFAGLYFIEYRDESQVRRMSVADTAFEVVDNAIAEAGIVTDGTVGGIMNALGITKDQVHALICNCHGESISGDMLADRFEQLAT